MQEVMLHNIEEVEMISLRNAIGHTLKEVRSDGMYYPLTEVKLIFETITKKEAPAAVANPPQGRSSRAGMPLFNSE